MKDGTKTQSRRPKQKVGLHRFVASGGKPKDYEPCQGVNSTTVPGYKGKKSY